MHLSRMRIRNFRCYGSEVAIDFNDLTAIIGKNDVGKSTILDALDIFLNDRSPDKDDATKGGDPTDLTIICEFSDLPSSVIIDDANPTSLAAEHLLNEQGLLEVHKSYKGQLDKPKLESVSVFAHHPTTNTVADLLHLNITKLKQRASDLGVELEGVDKTVSAQLRNAIRLHVGDMNLSPVLVRLNEENPKIWAGVKKLLPTFALFKSDRASTDQDSEAQDPLKIAVKEAIKSKQEELDAIASHVEQEVKKIADKTLEKLSEMDATLASQLNPQFSPLKWENLFKASITGDEDIPINKRGSGVKRLVLLNFFRAKAEQIASGGTGAEVIYAIEEPETSQHPNNQRMLLRALADLSIDAQVIVTTHTPMLARGIPDNSLRYVKKTENGKREILGRGSDTNEFFAKALGVLPDSGVRLFIGVEGPNDISFLQNVSKALNCQDSHILDLMQLEIDGQVIFIPLGGSTLIQWTHKLEPLNKPEFHLYDRDNEPPAPPKYQEQSDAVNDRENCRARSTVKREMENYIHWECIRDAYLENGSGIEISENFADFDDVPVEVAKLAHEASESTTAWVDLTPEKQGKKESRAKRMLNANATKHMTPEKLDEVDPEGDLRAWFKDIKELFEKAAH